MSKYYHLTVKEVVRETEDTVTLHFWHPPHATIPYKPGQFLTLILPVENKKVRRAYSMSSSPNKDASIAVTVKRLAGGLVSNYVNDQVKAGDVIEVMEPMGHFVCEPAAGRSRELVLFGAGSGVTPLISMIKSVLPVETNTRITLVYGSRNERNIIFRDQLAELEAQFAGRLTVVHVLSQPLAWDGRSGRVNQQAAIRILDELNIPVTSAEFYLCGPEGMMEEVQHALAILNVPKEQIHKESFAPSKDTHGEVVEDEDDGKLKTRTITLFYEGAEYKVEVKPHQTILEAGLELDIDLPYSCQAGMCTACMGRCKSGKVMMDEEDGLTEQEIAAGFVLTCVAHPMSADVVIEIE
ncbi:ferredoxin--NADP reductase [Siphonobacter aquaeclarae]|jgi:ring-1,2-phenylacetyl-CoA epoxidase subunit PaaE|uniref:Ring-1,2-phenylacetyl-CoA epoxidase subunit PaaE n=1 Tax=Siphonobacter aquaeclarae TaxID=563176 RepID=A0A1G9WXM7_9BACT|nr:ferredoxin--NADP reductase [Siphonobacter aquaeclarae]MBO9637908.1 ferredoxin--NADP reductase [Siphonobacter aquaeclarae]SDM89217.1 ring-1,2-phenylacetyl-CoA epoxidase subunit PaaE [Siphonobacter aquaeclarae]